MWLTHHLGRWMKWYVHLPYNRGLKPNWAEEEKNEPKVKIYV